MEIIVNIEEIEQLAHETQNKFGDADFYNTILESDSECRIWAYRLEKINNKLSLAAAALQVHEDDRTDVRDEAAQINTNVLSMMYFESTRTHFETIIQDLETQDRVLRGLEVDAQ